MALFGSTACTRTEHDEAKAAGSAKTADAAGEPPPSIRVTSDRRDLVFSYARPDGKGFETATEISAIPEAQRQTVVVTDLSLSPEQRQSGRYVYIADLRQPRADGSYTVALASRYGFEATHAGTSTATGASGSGEVVVYTTSWCGVCKHAKQLLKSLGVRFVEKDVEASRSAAEELAAKARRAGIQPGGVPVIDVGGTLMQGLDEASLRALLKEKGLI